MAAAPHKPDAAPHVPVLIRPLIKAVSPVTGTWIDGTFGAGGYTRALLEAGADKVVAIDRDPLAFEMAADWLGDYGARVRPEKTVFSAMDEVADQVDGVVLDLGVSSMQLDRAERGFSFMRDGPLDMRMSQQGVSAADLVNNLSEEELAAILFTYGEERASRRIAKNIARVRADTPFETTLQLAGVIERSLPRSKPGQSHPATRSFQALRIAVNDEYKELFQGLMAAERVLKPGGLLAVVTFHSIEDRMVKRFFTARAGHSGNTNRYAPQTAVVPAQFDILTRKAVGPDDQELEENPRSRSSRLRVARRTDMPAGAVDPSAIAMPQLKGKR
ncbi:16S rRNA (cytosine(1402)-N(4))-methyltransferase RsmH [Phaeobacter sp. J2-8]|uniref:16S rRNA (cytosine(1402)-N(4))-methyltransferase RsmH n=1 Tax=Phaeobacter sp. J2-8 TaxID=2931394 RepID=UPI001FD50CD8|nr:16S rRNA (cytosine(1402)-N(4))-methyltransferase RsmH [Phaeobacter sp. J2-8]MCJ7872522.1 16S rRNA (cytosine(1402)-N(4))-methyltransferase RsmH [Phaeobacter sp. J2-8]